MPLPDNPTIQFLIEYGYWFAVPVMIVEGPLATIVMGFFSSFGYFNPVVVFMFGFLADLVSDSAFYAIGYFNGDRFIRRFGRYFKLSERTFIIVRKFYEQHGGKSLFFAKLLTGTVPPVFIVAGYSKMNLRKFYSFAAMGGVLWSAGLVLLGYYFGSQFERNFANIGKLLGATGVVMVALLAFFVVYKFYLHRLVEQKLKLFFNSKQQISDGNSNLSSSKENQPTG